MMVSCESFWLPEVREVLGFLVFGVVEASSEVVGKMMMTLSREAEPWIAWEGRLEELQVCEGWAVSESSVLVCGGGEDTGDGEDIDSAGPAGVLVDAVDSDVTVVMTLWCGVGSSLSSLIYLEGGTILCAGWVIERLHHWVGGK